LSFPQPNSTEHDKTTAAVTSPAFKSFLFFILSQP
jgi:hypothetical protein